MQPTWKLLRPSSLAEITMGKSGKKERRKGEGGGGRGEGYDDGGAVLD